MHYISSYAIRSLVLHMKEDEEAKHGVCSELVRNNIHRHHRHHRHHHHTTYLTDLQLLS